MTDLMDLGRTLLDSTMESCRSVSAEFIKCGEVSGVMINVSPLGAQRRSDTGDHFVVDYEVQDFAIRLNTPVDPGGEEFQEWLERDVELGDRIILDGVIYRAGDDRGNPPFDFTSSKRTSIRIHSVMIGEVDE